MKHIVQVSVLSGFVLIVGCTNQSDTNADITLTNTSKDIVDTVLTNDVMVIMEDPAVSRVENSLIIETVPELILTEVPLGDDKTTLAAPQTGYVYLCRGMRGGGGAFTDGPWIHGDTWSPSEKTVTVDGAVTWENANVSFTVSDDQRVIVSNALPVNHTTGAYPISPNDDAYSYDRNPHSILEQSLNVTLPANPTASNSPSCVDGEVGIALTGVPIFNALDAVSRDAVAHEIQDDYGGHPQTMGMYHYHSISNAVAALGNGENGMTLVGYAFDGFGIYDDYELGKTLATNDLDECHGHSHEIAWDGVTQKMYHYHATQDYPYTVSCFRGQSTRHGPLGR